MQKNYFIVHGTGNNPYGNWFPWLFNKIVSRQEDCFVPHFPNDENQTYKNWKKVLDGYFACGLIHEDTIFIVHSVGAVFVTRYIVEKRKQIGGIVSVSGFNCSATQPEIELLNRSFLTTDKKLSKISRYVKFYHAIYSDNDPYLGFNELKHFAEITNAKTHEISNAGHFNLESGYKEFPFVLELLEKIDSIV